MLSIEGLSAGYGGAEVVRGVSLSVGKGSWDVILGPNGAGKTTLLRTIMGQIPPMRGKVEVDGLDCWDESLKIKRIVGYLPDAPLLYNELTGAEHLRFAGDMHEIPRREMLIRIGSLLELLDLARDANRRVAEYSFGMKRKLGVCMALIHQPRLLLLDEPTNGLDPVAAETMRTTLATLSGERGVAILMATHNMGMLHRYCDHVTILHKGEVCVTSGVSELIDARGGITLEEIFLKVVGAGLEDCEK